jgi:hypothetical protein
MTVGYGCTERLAWVGNTWNRYGCTTKSWWSFVKKERYIVPSIAKKDRVMFQGNDSENLGKGWRSKYETAKQYDALGLQNTKLLRL